MHQNGITGIKHIVHYKERCAKKQNNNYCHKKHMHLKKENTQMIPLKALFNKTTESLPIFAIYTDIIDSKSSLTSVATSLNQLKKRHTRDNTIDKLYIVNLRYAKRNDKKLELHMLCINEDFIKDESITDIITQF